MTRVPIAVLLVSLGVFGCSDINQNGLGAVSTAVVDWQRPDLVLGSLDTPATHVFGEITDVAVHGDSIYVLDGLASVVRLFEQTRYVGEVGGEGDGPGELRRPISVAAAPNGTIYVGQLNFTVDVFPGVPRADSVEQPNPLRTDVSARDLCINDSLLVLQGGHPERAGLVWEYSLGGALRTAYGSPPEIANPLLRHEMSRGRIACTPRGVLYAPVSDSVITAFDQEGEPSWRWSIPGFSTTDVELTKNGGYSVRLPETGWNATVGMVQWGPESVLLQVAYMTRESRQREDPWERLDSYEIGIADGDLRSTSSGIPLIVGTSPSTIVAAEEIPFPRLLIWER